MTSHDPKSESEDLDLGRPETCSRMTFYAVSFNTTIICDMRVQHLECKLLDLPLQVFLACRRP
jgi:hypothetical protein